MPNARAAVAAAVLALAGANPASATLTFTGLWEVPGGAVDLSGFGPGANAGRLNIGSDLFYDRATNSFWGLPDREPGGGLIDFAPRVHRFGLTLSPTGTITGFNLLQTVVFTRDGLPFTGLNPRLATGSAANLGRSLDPEGLVVLPNGNFLVNDEYGPSLYEFAPDGIFIRAFRTPDNLLPREPGGNLNFVDGRPTIDRGRQDNRGFEGLTISNDGRTVIGILQDPLVSEGAPDGRRSRNLRIVTYDYATGEPGAQYIYQLEALADINARVPGSPFGVNAQGRNIGVSAITMLPSGKLLVVERDNRGFGIEDPTATGAPVGTKRVYLISLAGATDVSAIDLTGTNALPAGVRPVSKILFLDAQAALQAAGVPVGEKIEGIAFGPWVQGGLSMFLVTDNDFSVTQTGAGVQFDICTSGVGGRSFQIPLNGICPEGTALIPSFIYGFRVSGASLAAVVPEPATWALLVSGFGVVGGALRLRGRRAALAGRGGLPRA